MEGMKDKRGATDETSVVLPEIPPPHVIDVMMRKLLISEDDAAEIYALIYNAIKKDGK